MAEQPHVRKTQARIAERERQRALQERNERLKWQIPIAAGLILLVLGVASLIFSTARPSSAAPGGAGGPQFQVDTQKIDLGDQPLGKTVKAVFNVKNTGGGTLSLKTPDMATLVDGC